MQRLRQEAMQAIALGRQKMRQFVEAKTRAEAIGKKGRDWAKIVKVEGGYAFFDSLNDYKIWKAQK